MSAPESSSRPNVGIAIVNYKTAPLVEDCLRSIAEHALPHCAMQVCVVDNASGDGSAERLAAFIATEDYGDWAHCLPAERNGGFAYGNNLAFKHLEQYGCDYLWLVNPDTRLQAGSLEALLALFAQQPGAGVAGSRLEDEDGTPQIAAFNFPTPLGELVNTSHFNAFYKLLPGRVTARRLTEHPESVDWVAGASMLISAAAVKAAGLMDENYFLYFEEVDYCRLIRAKGFSIWYVPDSRVVHMVGAATGISDMRKRAPRRPAYWFESRQRYFQKNFGFMRTLCADAAWVAGHSIARVKGKLKREPQLDPPHFMGDFIKHSAFVKGRTQR